MTEAYPKIEIRAMARSNDGGEECRGMDGRLVFPGVKVVCPAFYNEGLGRKVHERWGRVKRLYRQDGIKNPKSSCDVTVETTDGRYFWLDEVRLCRRTKSMAGGVLGVLLLLSGGGVASADPYDAWCENLGAVCRAECAGVRASYDYCAGDETCQDRRTELDRIAYERCEDDCRDRQESRCEARRR